MRTGSDRRLQKFLQLLNFIRPKVQLTLETEPDHNINYSDMNISINNNKVIFDIYRKQSNFQRFA